MQASFHVIRDKSKVGLYASYCEVMSMSSYNYNVNRCCVIPRPLIDTGRDPIRKSINVSRPTCRYLSRLALSYPALSCCLSRDFTVGNSVASRTTAVPSFRSSMAFGHSSVFLTAAENRVSKMPSSPGIANSALIIVVVTVFVCFLS